MGIVRMKTRYETEVTEVWSALTDPTRLAEWYGRFEGDLHLGGGFTAFVPSSGWDGHGRVEECRPRKRLSVTMWETEGDEQSVAVELFAEDEHTILSLEKGGVPPAVLWAFGCGWQAHLEDLAAHLAGQENPDLPASWNVRFEELEPSYRAMAVTPLPR
jgi:uncharacterized protein YndB with AHSA1/START domain